jgi:hypothetical protein
MKKTLCFLLTLMYLHTSSIHGQAVVTDPGSYAYYADQLAQAVEFIEKQTETISQLKDLAKLADNTANGVTSLASDVIGTYNNAIDLIDATENLIDTTEELPTELQNDYYKKIGEAEKNLAAFEKMEKFLDDKYRDPLSADYDPVRFDLFRFLLEKDTTETILKTSANNLAKTKDRVETIDSLAKKIDSTENIKDSQDLNNRLMSEILIVLTEMNDTFQQLAQLEAFGKYKGGDSEIAKESLQKIENNETPSYEWEDHPIHKRAKQAEKNNPRLKELPW